MAEITRKRTGELLRKLFEILMAHPDGFQAGVALERLAAAVKLTEYEAGVYESSGGRRFEKIVRFATVDCVKAGWLVKHKGTWTVTEAGAAAYKSFPEPDAFYREAVRLYRAWKASQPDETAAQTPTGVDGPSEEGAPQKSATITYEEADEQAWAEIERYLQKMPPYEFQQLVADLLEAMDYHVHWISPPGKDGGVDIIAFTDPLGTKAPRIKVQVKRTVEKVNTDLLKSFIATINEHDAGLYVSTGGFTRDAEEVARNQERRKITLIDLQRLVDLWIEHQQKLSDEAHRRLPLTAIFFLTPET